MKSFLVSFCNNKQNISRSKKSGILGLLTLNQNDLKYEELVTDIEDFDVINGATGLAKCEKYYYVVAQSKFSKLLILNRNFEILHCLCLNPLKGVHSILVHDKKLYLVATKQDKVVMFDFDEGFKQGIESGFETIYDFETNMDTHHINSICLHKGEIYVSAFGNKEKEFWVYAEDGYVVNIKTNEKFICDLKQPHSLFSYNGKLYVCDSSRKQIIDENKNIIVQNEYGYTRGLFINNSILIYGVSKGRIVSHSQKKYVGNISDKGILAGKSSVNVIGKDNNLCLSLEEIAEEVYDILSI